MKKNNNGLYPLRCAITSLSAENLQTLMTSANQIDNDQDDILFSMIVNEKLEAGNNFLHNLVEQMTEENYSEVSEMIKTLVTNKCSANSPNHQLDTPFYSLLKKVRGFSIENDLIEFFIRNCEIDFNSSKVTGLIEQFQLIYQIPLHEN